MPISVDWATKVITVPQSYCTLISGTLYELDTDQFWKDLKDLEAAETGIVFEDAQRHAPNVTVAGVTYAQVIEIINGYSIVFSPDAQWTVRLAGSNNNIFDVESGILGQNQVQVISTNSAGLQLVTVGSGVLPQDIADIATAVWDEPTSAHTDTATMGGFLTKKVLTVAKFLGLK